MSLQDEIDNRRADIRTDEYAMSIGEWISLYERSEVDIHPEFQRFFRWTPEQKTSLIESIILGIPVPPIFVSQRKDGIWDVVDGLQRLSTIFEFFGILRDEAQQTLKPLTLLGTKYLPSLAGKMWEDEDNPENSFDVTQRLYVKRAKFYVNIILQESDPKSKYELFQRLNTGGSQLSDQEVRNCILVSLNREMFFWVRELARDQNFIDCVALTDKAREEQYDLNLVLRFIVFRTLALAEAKKIGDVNIFLTDKMVEIAENKKFDFVESERAFRSTFALLANTIGDDSFRRLDDLKNKFMGGFILSAFETIALGIGHNYANLPEQKEILSLVKKVWGNEIFIKYSGSGVRASSRIPNLLPLGRKIFKP